MSVRALAHVDPTQFFHLPYTNSTGTQRLDTQVSGVTISNNFSGRMSVTTVEGDTITLSADLESDFHAMNDKSRVKGDGTTVYGEATYAEYSLKQEFGVTVEGDLNEQEMKDLASLFRKVANIFKPYLRGQDDEALAKTVTLGNRFGNFSSLSDLSLNVDLERSVTVFAAQVAAEVAGQPGTPAALPASTPTAPTTQAVTQGEAPSTVAATPRPSIGITMPNQIAAPVLEPRQPLPIVQQVLDAIQDARVESRKLNKYVSQFLENLEKALQNRRPDESHAEGSQTNQTPPVLSQTGSAAYLAYQSTRQTVVSLSILG